MYLGSLYQLFSLKYDHTIYCNYEFFVSVLTFNLIHFDRYLPPYTSFLPIEKDEVSLLKLEGKEKRRNRVVENIIFSQLSYLAIFIMLICITERKSLKEDPLNFSVMNITLEVIR